MHMELPRCQWLLGKSLPQANRVMASSPPSRSRVMYVDAYDGGGLLADVPHQVRLSSLALTFLRERGSRYGERMMGPEREVSARGLSNGQ